MIVFIIYLSFFFFNDTATTEIYTLSLHDALPISSGRQGIASSGFVSTRRATILAPSLLGSTDGAKMVADRKSTRLNSSHLGISYAVFCLKKKKTIRIIHAYVRGYLVATTPVTQAI